MGIEKGELETQFPPEETLPKFTRPEHFLQLLSGVVGQEDMKRKLAGAFSEYTLFLNDESVGRPVVLTYGPSGSGKTWAIEIICRATGLPFTSVSSASISPPSFKGLTLRDLLVQHFLTHRTDTGVIFLDEVDKWCKGVHRESDKIDAELLSHGRGLQAEVLRYIESEVVAFLDESKDLEELQGVTFNTKRIMWVLAGAFVGLDRIVRNRLHNEYLPNEETWEKAQPSDFIQFGMLAELAGRVQTWAWVRPLKDMEVMQILRQQELPKWLRRFKALDCELEIEDGALGRCAEAGRLTGTGARGAASLLRRSLEDIYVEASRHGSKTMKVDAKTVLTGRVEFEEALAI